MLQCVFNFLYRKRRKWRKYLTGLFIIGAVLSLIVYVISVASLHHQVSKGTEKIVRDINKKIKYLQKNIDDIEYIRGMIKFISIVFRTKV